MGFDEGQIVLDSPNGAYYSGQTVFGKLVFQADKAMIFRGIYMRFKGYCKVHWTTSYNRTSNGRTQTYHQDHTSEEEYVRMKTYLIGGESGECALQPGPYEFPFQCALPGNCPSSFEGTHGHVRYEIKVVVDRAFKLDKEKKVAVRVLAPVNLNTEPYCKEPIQFEFSDTYCCCCMNYGSSETVIKLPVSGYCPGQVIPIEVGCINRGSVEIDEIKFSIKKIITFRATHNPATKSEEEKVTRIKKGPVPANSTRNWEEELPVPALDVYNLSTCQFIDIDYEFKVEVCPEGCHSNSGDMRRIIIGNIPLVGFQDNIQNPLHDQMPQQFVPVVNQPVPSMPLVSPYPSSNAPYPNVTPVPNNQYPNTTSPYPNQPYENQPATNPAAPTSNSPYPMTNAPYPTSNSPYPTSNSPYPSSTSPYPTSTSPYPANPPPYSTNTPNPTPYPTSNPPYPNVSPYPGANPPYPPEKAPYPTANPTFPTPQQNLQFPSSNQPGVQPGSFGGPLLKTGTLGFGGPAVMPTTNPASPMAPANPYATASAPADFPDEGKQ